MKKVGEGRVEGRGGKEGVSILPDFGSAYRLCFPSTLVILSSLWV